MNKNLKIKSSVNSEQLELSSPVLVLRKVGANSHVSFDGAYYSVPHVLYASIVIIRATDSFT